jgi:hypothetical protein
MHGLTGGGWKRKRSATVTGVAQPTGNYGKKGPGTYRRPAPPRQPPTLHGAFYRSELRFLAWRINEHLARWAMHKFKRFRGKYAKAMAWLQKVYQYQPRLFAHWQLVAFT